VESFTRLCKTFNKYFARL